MAGEQRALGGIPWEGWEWLTDACGVSFGVFWCHWLSIDEIVSEPGLLSLGDYPVTLPHIPVMFFCTHHPCLGRLPFFLFVEVCLAYHARQFLHQRNPSFALRYQE